MSAPPLRSLLSYSVLALPLAFAGLPLYMHMPDFYTVHFGLSLNTLATILLLVRLIDAFQDPLIGYVSDRVRTHERLVMFGGSGLLVLGFAGLCFGPPLPSMTALWFVICMIAATTGFSVLTINLNRTGGLWSDNAQQRVRISSWREALGLVGLLIAAMLPTMLQYALSAPLSFAALFAVFAVLFCGALWVFNRFMHDAAPSIQPAARTDHAPFAMLSILTRHDKLFWGVCFTSYIAASMPAILVLFFIRDYLGAQSLTGGFLALYFLSGAGFMSVWIALSKRFGGYQAWLGAGALSILTFIGAGFLSAGDAALYGVICVASGIALGADLSLPPALLAGRIAAHNNDAQATQYYAVLAFLPKLAMALAASAAFYVLGQVGFEASADNTPRALNILLVLYAFVPCVFKAISAGLLCYLIKKEGQIYEFHQERSAHHGTTNIS